eukprot:CAMPEP_0184211414 /NCGR_PEP_ID=MMETSP0976-20121227/13117_1 /TAXON_ID=483370 /ORGANISM="non described non described, Strain CCMP2097" /LENGTH=59 /DNA_ID=CAMNT_0026516117 /DNA_START=58 /DNA_END=234 /DNA_ORIENTATION=-
MFLGRKRGASFDAACAVVGEYARSLSATGAGDGAASRTAWSASSNSWERACSASGRGTV